LTNNTWCIFSVGERASDVEIIRCSYKAVVFYMVISAGGWETVPKL